MDHREQNDSELLQELIERGSETAFATIYERHSQMVRSACQRILGNEQDLANDAAQSVFLILREKAKDLNPNVILGGWLYRTAIFTAKFQKRSLIRRKHYEGKVATMEERALEIERPVEWAKIRHLLDEAIAILPKPQAEAIVLRLLEDRPLTQVAAETHCSEEALRKRVARALDKMRQFLRKKGIMTSSSALSSLIIAYSPEVEAAALPVEFLQSTSSDASTWTPDLISKEVLTAMRIKQSATKLGIAASALLVVSMATGVFLNNSSAKPEEKVMGKDKVSIVGKNSKKFEKRNEKEVASTESIQKKPLKELYKDYMHYLKVINKMHEAGPQKLYGLLRKYAFNIDEKIYWNLIEEIKREYPLKAPRPFGKLEEILIKRRPELIAEGYRHAPCNSSEWGKIHEVLEQWLSQNPGAVKKFCARHEFKAPGDIFMKSMLGMISSPAKTLNAWILNHCDPDDSSKLSNPYQLKLLFRIWVRRNRNAAIAWLRERKSLPERTKLYFEISELLINDSPREALEFHEFLEKNQLINDENYQKELKLHKLVAKAHSKPLEAFESMMREKLPFRQHIYIDKVLKIWIEQNPQGFLKYYEKHFDKFGYDHQMLFPLIAEYLLDTDKPRLFILTDRINPERVRRRCVIGFLNGIAQRYPDQVYSLAKEFENKCKGARSWENFTNLFHEYQTRDNPFKALEDMEKGVSIENIMSIVKIMEGKQGKKETLLAFFPNMNFDDKEEVKINMLKFNAIIAPVGLYIQTIDRIARSDPNAVAKYIIERKLFMGFLTSRLVESFINNDGKKAALDFINSLPPGKARINAIEKMAEQIVRDDGFGKALNYIKQELPEEKQVNIIRIALHKSRYNNDNLPEKLGLLEDNKLTAKDPTIIRQVAQAYSRNKPEEALKWAATLEGSDSKGQARSESAILGVLPTLRKTPEKMDRILSELGYDQKEIATLKEKAIPGITISK